MAELSQRHLVGHPACVWHDCQQAATHVVINTENDAFPCAGGAHLTCAAHALVNESGSWPCRVAPLSNVLDEVDRTIVHAGLTALLGMWASARESFGDQVPDLAHSDRIRELIERLA